MRPLDLLHDRQSFISVLICNGERRAAVPAQCGVTILDCTFYILRVVIDASNYDKVLNSSSYEQFTVFV